METFSGKLILTIIINKKIDSFESHTDKGLQEKSFFEIILHNNIFVQFLR
jgi:hypothetical protein